MVSSSKSELYSSGPRMKLISVSSRFERSPSETLPMTSLKWASRLSSISTTEAAASSSLHMQLMMPRKMIDTCSMMSSSLLVFAPSGVCRFSGGGGSSSSVRSTCVTHPVSNMTGFQTKSENLRLNSLSDSI